MFKYLRLAESQIETTIMWLLSGAIMEALQPRINNAAESHNNSAIRNALWLTVALIFTVNSLFVLFV